MIKTSYNQQENILYIERSGEITLEAMLELLYKLIADYGNFCSLYILENSGNSSMQYNEDDHQIVLDHIANEIYNFNEVRHAMIVKNPEETVYSILFESRAIAINKYHFKAFSTESEAIPWLKKGIYYSCNI